MGANIAQPATRAVAVIWTEDDRSGGAPAVSVDEGIADAVFAAFPPNS